jgi:hypothetical protein
MIEHPDTARIQYVDRAFPQYLSGTRGWSESPAARRFIGSSLAGNISHHSHDPRMVH